MNEYIHIDRLNKVINSIVPTSEIFKLSPNSVSSHRILLPLHQSFIKMEDHESGPVPFIYLQDIVSKNISLKLGSNKFEVDKDQTTMSVLKSIAGFLDDKKSSQKGHRRDSRVHFSTLLNNNINNSKLQNLFIAIFETMMEKPLSSDTLLKLCKDLNSKYNGGDE